ncbi:MAG: hypothetical protein ACWGQW_11395 [bacterium]
MVDPNAPRFDEDFARRLDGKELLAQAFICGMMSVQNPTNDDVDLGEEVMQTLKELTEIQKGPYGAGEWLCISFEDYSVGRAVPYKGEHRIVPIESTDTEVSAATVRRINERKGKKIIGDQAEDG